MLSQLQMYLPYIVAFLAGGLVQTKYDFVAKLKSFFNKTDSSEKVHEALVAQTEALTKVATAIAEKK